jgi:hypothetical protein
VKFDPWNSLQIVCGAKCALVYFRKQDTKRRRREKREGRERLRSRRDWLRLAQVACNAYIRERDKYRACISCGRFNNVKRNAGHYLSVGSHPELRFDERNIHVQCEACNSFLSGNVAAYRVGLIARVGQEVVDYLEGPHEPRKYTVDELRDLGKYYRLKLKSLRQVAA